MAMSGDKTSSRLSDGGFLSKTRLGPHDGYDPKHMALYVGSSGGEQVKVYTNAYAVQLNPEHGIAVFIYSFTPRPEGSVEEDKVIEAYWPQLQEALTAFAFAPLEEHSSHFGGARHIFVPRHCVEKREMKRGDAIELKPVKVGDREQEYLLRVTFDQMLSAVQVNDFQEPICFKIVGVARQWLKKNLTLNGRCKVGERYFRISQNLAKTEAVTKGNQPKEAMESQTATLMHTPWSGMVAILDGYNKVIDPVNVLQSVANDLMVEPGQKGDAAIPKPNDEEDTKKAIRLAWERKVVGKTVITMFNKAVYKIDAVLWDQTPESTFIFQERTQQGKQTKQTTYAQHVKDFYEIEITEVGQPMLKAVPKNKKESCQLIPEICYVMGIQGDGKTATQQLAKINPADRFLAAKSAAESINSCPSRKENPKTKLHEWYFQLGSEPISADARKLGSVKVQFKDSVEIKDGDLSKSIRLGLLSGAVITQWLVIGPSSLTTWTETMEKLAKPMGITLSPPKIVDFVNIKQTSELQKVLEEHVTDDTQLVLLMTHGVTETVTEWDLTQAYTLLKRFCCLTKPMASQFLRSDVLKKARAPVKNMIRLVLQINGKLGGESWRVEVECEKTKPFFHRPTMCIGIDVFYNKEDNSKCLGFVASLGRENLEYISLATMIPADSAGAMSEKIQDFLREAFVAFARKNNELAPEHIVVYRGSARPEDLELIEQSEVGAFLAFIKNVKPMTALAYSDSNKPPTSSSSSTARVSDAKPYNPELHFLAVRENVELRFYSPDEKAKASSEAASSTDDGGATNPIMCNLKPGMVIDDPLLTPWGYPSFYLNSTQASAGVSIPSLYSLLHPNPAKDDTLSTAAPLQELTYRLCYGYFNAVMSIGVPAPLQYARKLAEFVGTSIKQDPHPRLQNTLYYL